jgi:2-keto-4-pentenoate hydratase/2-oxohepta-3-ene-1,7-dioic acid hydratase in catechol pathway
MRFVTFEPAPGLRRFGFLAENGRIVDVEGAYAALLARTLPADRALRMASVMAPADALAFIEGGAICLDAARQARDAVEEDFARNTAPTGPNGEAIDFDPARVTICAPLQRPRNFIASGKNFNDHLNEMQQSNRPVAPRIPSGHPQYPSAIVGPDVTVPIPKETKKLDYEVEMAMIIGRRAYRIGQDEALDHVFGVTVYNDLSARDMGEQEWGVPMLQKNLPGFAPMGPYIVTTDELGDLETIGLRSRINGELRQNSTIADMRFKIRDQISFWSQIGLEPGDVITTGTPGGVAAGRHEDEEPWWLKPGDVVECEVDRVGTLTTYIG